VVWTCLSVAVALFVAVPFGLARVLGAISAEVVTLHEAEETSAAPLTRALDQLA
jgi:hypothetical protein